MLLDQWLFFLPKCCLLLALFLCIDRVMFEVTHYLDTISKDIPKVTVTKGSHVLERELSNCNHHVFSAMCSYCGNPFFISPGLCYGHKGLCSHLQVPKGGLLHTQSKWLEFPDIICSMSCNTKVIGVDNWGSVIPNQCHKSGFLQHTLFYIPFAGFFWSDSLWSALYHFCELVNFSDVDTDIFGFLNLNWVNWVNWG